MSSFILLLVVCASLIGCCLASSSITIFPLAGCTGSSVSATGQATTQGSSSLACNSISGVSGVQSWSVLYTGGAGAVNFYTDSACGTASPLLTGFIGTSDGKTCISISSASYRSGYISSNSGFNIYSSSLPLMILLAILSILSISLM